MAGLFDDADGFDVYTFSVEFPRFSGLSKKKKKRFVLTKMATLCFWPRALYRTTPLQHAHKLSLNGRLYVDYYKVYDIFFMFYVFYVIDK